MVKIPVLNVADMIHSCGPEGMCIATVVAGIMNNFDTDGSIVVHIMLAAPGMPGVCNHNAIKYHKPESKDDRPLRTWHLKEECVGGCKRMGAEGRLIH